MAPRTQYVTTADGVRIAYWTLGSGQPFLHLPVQVSNLELEWQIPEIRHWYEQLAERFLLVRYDARGTGVSQRSVSMPGPAVSLPDLEAVAERIDRSDLLLFSPGAHSENATRFARLHPERVGALIFCGGAGGFLLASKSLQRGFAGLAEADWDFYCEVLAQFLVGLSHPEHSRRYASLIKQSVDRESWSNRLRAVIERTDPGRLLGEPEDLKAPTLLMTPTGRNMVTLDEVRGIASRLPNGQMAVFEAEGTMPWLWDIDAVLKVIDDFVSEVNIAKTASIATSVPATSGPRSSEAGAGTVTILFLDIVDSTPLTERLGDAAFRSLARDLDAILRALVRDHGGAVVEGKVLGDGVMAAFASASRAIEAALKCNEAAAKTELQLHLGLHAGDVIHEGDNVYGGTVNLAARVCGLSAPGEVLVSETVRALARTSAGVRFDDRGLHELKGIEEPQRLFAVLAAA